MKILITNWHVPYIWMLAHTHHEFYIINPPGRHWDLRMRPIPENVTLLDSPDLHNINKLQCDRIILQESDIVALKQFKGLGVPIILLFHNSMQTNIRGATPEYKQKVNEQLPKLLDGMCLVFISEFKKKSFGLDGDVVLPGISENEFEGWDGKGDYILSCVNNANARDFMNGSQKMKIATKGLDWTLLGEEDGAGLLANDFAHLKEYYAHARFFLALNEMEYEDGYNLSLLEAMMCGCPGITLDHPTSPIKHGFNGFKSDNLQTLNQLMQETPYEQIRSMGINARQTVLDKFPLDRFIHSWNEILQK